MVAGQLYMVYEAGRLPRLAGGRGALSGLARTRWTTCWWTAWMSYATSRKSSNTGAPGSTAGSVCREAVVDELAEMLGRDPMDLASRTPSRKATACPTASRIACLAVVKWKKR